ncbi:MAG: alpha-galactosidase, partial [Actinomycetota bacterium]|nr:alpha-galactosidase [Actinomycetota bacterium]
MQSRRDGDAAHGTDNPGAGLLHLRSAGVSLVLDARGESLPRVLHWGRDLGDVDYAALHSLAVLAVPPATSNTLDDVAEISLLPEHSRGWFGSPGLAGHRDGADWSARFVTRAVDRADDDAAQRIHIEAVDPVARLALTIEVEVTASGLVRMRALVRNEDDASAYTLDGLLLALPVPAEAAEVLDFTGGHTRE